MTAPWQRPLQPRPQLEMELRKEEQRREAGTRPRPGCRDWALTINFGLGFLMVGGLESPPRLRCDE